MLGQQYYENPKFHEYLDTQFVMLRADRTTKRGAELANENQKNYYKGKLDAIKKAKPGS